jgi:outer membrane receptor protein involved in Fe transport
VTRVPAAVVACLLPLFAAAQQGEGIPQPTGPGGPRGPNPHAPPALRPTQPQKPAAQQQPPKEEAQKIEKIEVQADSLAERRESTASKIIVNHEEINKYGDTNVMDVLKRLPGITVDSGPGGRGGAIRMRGLGTGYTQILVNGERMPPGFTLDSIAPDMIERIEIIRGATAELSTQAVAGTINVVLRRALTQQKAELRAGASVQNDKPTVFVSGNVSDRAGALTWTIPFNLLRFSFANDGLSEQRVIEPDLDVVQRFASRRGNEGWGGNMNVAPRLSWTLGPNNTLNLDAFALTGLFRGRFTEDNTPQVGPPPPYVNTDLRVRNQNNSYRVNANWVRRFADNARLDARLGVSHFDFDAAATFAARDVSGATALIRVVDSTAHDTTTTTVGKYTFPVVRGHNFATGWDGAYTMRGDDRLQADFFPLTSLTARRDENFDTTVRRLALYVQDEWEVSEKFAIYTGLRWEGIETRSVGNAYDPIRNRSGVASPIMNLLWKLPGTDKDQVRLGIARTYKPINTGDLVPRRFFAPNNSPTTPDFIGNPRLKPELSWGLDAGYEHYPAGGGNIGLSVYHRRIEDIVQRQTTFEDGLYITRPENLGSGTVTGVEFDAKGKLSQLVPGWPGVDLRANFAVNKSKVDFLPGPFNRLDSQVPWNGTLGADYRFTVVPLTVGTSFTARGAGTVRTSVSQLVYSSVNRQWEAFALWRFSPKLQLRASVQDLLAQDAVTVNRFTDSTGVVTERSSIDPRFRRVSLLWEIKL